jgi:DNA (cytosine-5)-methyltransferase 1
LNPVPGEAMPSFYEFFAGGGMARAGLGPGWTCLMANDVDPRKADAYRANWGPADNLRVGDIGALTLADLPGQADLAWGSFPCQDLSLAGVGAGLAGARSGTFHAFWRLMRGLIGEGRGPRIIALENVCGALTSHGGADFQAIGDTFAEAGYRLGALVIDAALFTPQSRPRLFLIGVDGTVDIDGTLCAAGPSEPFHPPALRRAVERSGQDNAVWWRVPVPPHRNLALADVIESEPSGLAWHSPSETARLLGLMAPANLAKVEAARRSGGRSVGAVYRRTRRDRSGVRIQRAEVRFDGVSGCLRTPAGGSSRQLILVVDGQSIRSRLITARETARLMGLGEDYALPANYNEAYHLTGDGVVVNVVRHLAAHLLEPLLKARAMTSEAA